MHTKHRPCPETTIITFDLHGVIFKPDYRQLARIVWHSQGKLWLILNLMHPKVVYMGFVMLFKRSAAEKYIMQLAQINPRLKPYIQLGIDLSNAQQPIPENVALAQQLKKDGYTLHILSNLGIRSLEQLRPKYEDIFALFDAIRVTMPEDDYLNKPNKGIYYDYLAKHNPENKQIILIDDGKENVQVANELGMIGIYFKNNEQLIAALTALDVL